VDESPFGPEVESIATSLGILRRLGGRRAAARAAELPAREYAVAEVVDLVASRGYSSPGEVAATLGLAQSRASVLVRRALDARWLVGEPGPWDARVTVVSVTDEGRRLVELLQADRCTTVDRATVFWPEEDRTALARLLERFAEAVERPFRW
jgi:DNA-binding MarR family transcriptional regulator